MSEHEQLKPLEGALERLRDWATRNGDQVRELYAENPIELFRTFIPEVKWPRVWREAFLLIWHEQPQRVIIKGPRGGGKSLLLSVIGFALWYIRLRKVIDMGGSLEQAKQVYNYLDGYCRADDRILATLPKPPTITSTETEKGNYFKCVTASQKQVRGPHPDVLLSDETAEAEDELIQAALPMVNTSQNPLVIMASTFHKIFGIFQETWDDAPTKGYVRIAWDMFDVTQEFDADIWESEKYSDIPDLHELKELATGRTGDPEGWVKVESIIQAWREKPTKDWFLVEYMGSRPSRVGLILDPVKVESSEIEELPDDIGEEVGGVDWGFSGMTATLSAGRYGRQVVVTYNKNYSQIPSEEIIQDLVEQAEARKWPFIYADSAAKFENVALQAALKRAGIACEVIEVVFSTEKPGMVGNLRAYFEQERILILKKFKTLLWQLKRYRYAKNSDMPLKKDDHGPDALMCALNHWMLNLIPQRLDRDMVEDDEDEEEDRGLLDTRF